MEHIKLIQLVSSLAFFWGSILDIEVIYFAIYIIISRHILGSNNKIFPYRLVARF